VVIAEVELLAQAAIGRQGSVLSDLVVELLHFFFQPLDLDGNLPGDGPGLNTEADPWVFD
jgi:hypothetical protein